MAAASIGRAPPTFSAQEAAPVPKLLTMVRWRAAARAGQLRSAAAPYGCLHFASALALLASHRLLTPSALRRAAEGDSGDQGLPADCPAEGREMCAHRWRDEA